MVFNGPEGVKTDQTLAHFGLNLPEADFWVFGYGSLMWNPGFPFRHCVPARAFGYHRDFAMRSIRHRGTPKCPGLVLALCPGGSCTGRAFLVARAQGPGAISYLLDREMGTYAYRPALIFVHRGAERVRALTFLPTAQAPQFVPGLDRETQARAIAAAAGGMGSNQDYLHQTIREMERLNLPTEKFQALERRVLQLKRFADPIDQQNAMGPY